MISYNMSELIRVSNLTNFQEFSTACRKPVDNPAALGASQNVRKGNGGGGIPDVQPPPSF
jgi:hypothetical protein